MQSAKGLGFTHIGRSALGQRHVSALLGVAERGCRVRQPLQKALLIVLSQRHQDVGPPDHSAVAAAQTAHLRPWK
jgi:hypothetical protein